MRLRNSSCPCSEGDLQKIIRQKSTAGLCLGEIFMLKYLALVVLGLFVIVATPSAQAAPAAGLSSLKSTSSVVEPVYWRYHRHWHHYRYWRHPYYWRHRHYYRYWGPAHRRCGWGWGWW